MNNYRPISILPVISKVAEKWVAEHLTSRFNKSNMFYQMQFGFRNKHSTETAICCFIERIESQLDSYGEVFLDLKKAFDTVNQGSSTFFRPRTPKLMERWSRDPLLYILYKIVFLYTILCFYKLCFIHNFKRSSSLCTGGLEGQVYASLVL